MDGIKDKNAQFFLPPQKSQSQFQKNAKLAKSFLKRKSTRISKGKSTDRLQFASFKSKSPRRPRKMHKEIEWQETDYRLQKGDVFTLSRRISATALNQIFNIQ